MTSNGNNFNDFSENRLTEFRQTAHLRSLQFATGKKIVPPTFSGKNPASTRQRSGRPWPTDAKRQYLMLQRRLYTDCHCVTMYDGGTLAVWCRDAFINARLVNIDLMNSKRLGSRVVSVLDSGAGVQIAIATPSGDSLRQTVHTHRASVHQAAKLVAALLRVARLTAGLAESNGSLLPGLWLTSPAGWLPRTGISSALYSTLGNRVWATFLYGIYVNRRCVLNQPGTLVKY